MSEANNIHVLTLEQAVANGVKPFQLKNAAKWNFSQSNHERRKNDKDPTKDEDRANRLEEQGRAILALSKELHEWHQEQHRNKSKG